MTENEIPTLDVSNLPEAVTVAAGGGSRTFGNTVISWVPSSTEPAVEVTVTMGGVIISKKTLTPNDNQMTYSAKSGNDWSRGIIVAVFGPTGKTGQLQGDLQWEQGGFPGNYNGFIGEWSV